MNHPEGIYVMAQRKHEERLLNEERTRPFAQVRRSSALRFGQGMISALIAALAGSARLARRSTPERPAVGNADTYENAPERWVEPNIWGHEWKPRGQGTSGVKTPCPLVSLRTSSILI